MMRKAQKRMSSSRLRMLSKNAVILGIGNFQVRFLSFFGSVIYKCFKYFGIWKL